MFKPPKITRFESKLLAIVDLTSDVKEFHFSKPEGFVFVPGQFITLLFTTSDGKTYRRPYSVASSPSESELKLCVKKVENGPGTTYLWNLSIGDFVNFMGPLGVFVIKEDPSAIVLLSSGTGIAPFRSMILNHISTGSTVPITLLCGFRHELLYHDEFVKLSQEYSWFTYIPTLSQGSAKDAYAGRITAHVADIINTQAHYYVCGLTEMIKDVCSKLGEHVAREQIHFERYD